jgi:hypothetical protein
MSDDSVSKRPHQGPLQGTTIGISLMVSTPPPRPSAGEHKRMPSVEDKVRKCIERIDNGCGTEVDFLTLKKLKAAIQARKKITPRMKNILDMIEPVIQRFGYYF